MFALETWREKLHCSAGAGIQHPAFGIRQNPFTAEGAEDAEEKPQRKDKDKRPCA